MMIDKVDRDDCKQQQQQQHDRMLMKIENLKLEIKNNVQYF